MAGAPKGMGTQNVYKKMMDNPIHQQREQDIASAEGRNNMAVSQMDRMIGADVAGEQKRLMGLDRAGMEIARRSDQLAFARKGLAFQKERAAKNIEKQESQRLLKKAELSQSQQLFNDQQDDNFGLEMGLGLLTTGVNIYSGLKATDKHKEYMAAMNRMSSLYYSSLAKQGDWAGNPEE